MNRVCHPSTGVTPIPTAEPTGVRAHFVVVGGAFKFLGFFSDISLLV